MDPIVETNRSITSSRKNVKNLPISDVDFLTLAKTVETSWLANPNFQLIWISTLDYSALLTSFEASFNARKQSGGVRPQYTRQLKELDKEIDKSLSFIKNYIADKYGKDNATSYYAEFGIEKSKKGYTLPQDRNSRNTALGMLLTGIDTHNFITMTYGKSYWQPIATQYSQLLLQSQQTDSSISQNVGNKNYVKEQIKQVLDALMLLIKANYPNTYKNELRNWGFQKEKY